MTEFATSSIRRVIIFRPLSTLLSTLINPSRRRRPGTGRSDAAVQRVAIPRYDAHSGSRCPMPDSTPDEKLLAPLPGRVSPEGRRVLEMFASSRPSEAHKDNANSFAPLD